jgi:hypothetical protein
MYLGKVNCKVCGTPFEDHRETSTGLKVCTVCLEDREVQEFLKFRDTLLNGNPYATHGEVLENIIKLLFETKKQFSLLETKLNLNNKLLSRR